MSRVDEVKERISYASNALIVGRDMTNVLLSQISVSLAYIVDAFNADRKTEPKLSEIPTSKCHYGPKYEPQTDCETCRYAGECDWEPWQECPYAPKTEPQMDIHGITDCDFCKHGSEEWDSEACDGCCENNDHFEPKDEPQTERSE